MAARSERSPIAPTAGPPPICPNASACETIDSTVARTRDGMLRLSQVVAIGYCSVRRPEANQ